MQSTYTSDFRIATHDFFFCQALITSLDTLDLVVFSESKQHVSVHARLSSIIDHDECCLCAYLVYNVTVGVAGPFYATIRDSSTPADIQTPAINASQSTPLPLFVTHHTPPSALQPP